MKDLGHISLNISACIYFLYFLPQLSYNQIYKRTSKISLQMQLIMVLASSLDLTYNIGFELPRQYIWVSVISLVALFVQQVQIFQYGTREDDDRTDMENENGGGS